MTEAHLLLIRHAKSASDPNTPEPDWPLTEAGEKQAQELVTSLSPHGISAIYTSPFVRARATVQPLAVSLGIQPSVDPDLRERKLREERVGDWRELIVKSWEDFDFGLPNCETSRDCQTRMRNCLDRIATAHLGETVAVCSHGNAIALFLNSIDPAFGYEGWRSMTNPHVFRLSFTETTWSRIE